MIVLPEGDGLGQALATCLPMLCGYAWHAAFARRGCAADSCGSFRSQRKHRNDRQPRQVSRILRGRGPGGTFRYLVPPLMASAAVMRVGRLTDAFSRFDLPFRVKTHRPDDLPGTSDAHRCSCESRQARRTSRRPGHGIVAVAQSHEAAEADDGVPLRGRRPCL